MSHQTVFAKERLDEKPGRIRGPQPELLIPLILIFLALLALLGAAAIILQPPLTTQSTQWLAHARHLVPHVPLLGFQRFAASQLPLQF